MLVLMGKKEINEFAINIYDSDHHLSKFLIFLKILENT
jgi:hypothetical protein